MKPSLLAALCGLAFCGGACAAPDALLTQPDIQNGRIVFVHAGDLYMVGAEGGTAFRLTSHQGQELYPKFSPDGSRIAFVSFPPGTLGHPADLPVLLRLIEADGTVRDLISLFGGQGTINVASWAPDGRRLAYVDYPIEG